jgi:hypothetical protein
VCPGCQSAARSACSAPRWTAAGGDACEESGSERVCGVEASFERGSTCSATLRPS